MGHYVQDFGPNLPPNYYCQSVEITHRLSACVLARALLRLDGLSLRVLLASYDHFLLLEGEFVEVVDLRGQLTLLLLMNLYFSLQVCDVRRKFIDLVS